MLANGLGESGKNRGARFCFLGELPEPLLFVFGLCVRAPVVEQGHRRLGRKWNTRDNRRSRQLPHQMCESTGGPPPVVDIMRQPAPDRLTVNRAGKTTYLRDMVDTLVEFVVAPWISDLLLVRQASLRQPG